MSGRESGAVPVAELSRKLTDFLVDLSIGLHKNAIYPPGHPMLEGATSGISTQLAELLQDRPSLSLGVARDRLIIEGVASDESNPVLRDLAQRLHRHHLGAIRFTRGITPEELATSLALLAVDSGRRDKPLGLEGSEVLMQWPHVHLLPLTFGQLELMDQTPAEGASGDAEMRTDARSAQLWIGLARASLAATAGEQSEQADAGRLDATENTDPEAVAKAIDAHDHDAAYDQVVVGYLLQIAEQIKTKGDRESAALQKRLSNLVSTLKPSTLDRLLSMGGDAGQRRRFLSDAAQGMAAEAVIELVRSAANASGQTISSSMMRMLSKLAVHAGDGSAGIRQQADSALREQVLRLISDWKLDDPNPDGYRVALDKMSDAGPDPAAARSRHVLPCEPERLVQMGIEVGTVGPPVWRAIDALSARSDLTPVLDLLERAPEGAARRALTHHVLAVDRLRRQLERTPVDFQLVRRMVAQMRTAAVEPLLDALETAEDRQALAYMDLLAELGRDSGPLVVARLRGARWGVQRRLLAVLGHESVKPDDFSAAAYRAHPDAAVRREALRIMLRDPHTHARAVLCALGDRDERNVRMAIGAVMSSCPAEAASMLMTRADDDTLSPELRALGVRALASYTSPETRRFLVERATGRSAILRRRILASKSPEMLAALAGLATYWREHPEAASALALATTSDDREVRDAVTRRVSTP